MHRAGRGRSVLSAGAVLGAALLALGCHSHGNVIRLNAAAHGHTVPADVGDDIEVTLQVLLSSGHYVTPTTSSVAVRYLGESPVSPPTPGGPTQRFRFEAVAPGRADITIPHTQLPTPFELTVEVN